jgi:trans-2,3-dihydro-3-hydroxyanthranilate isomerase
LPVHVDEHGARVDGGTPGVGPRLDAAELAAAVGLSAADVEDAIPAGAASAGVSYAYLPLKPDAVARADVNPTVLRRVLAEADLSGHPGVMIVSFDRGAGHAHVRMFAPELGVVEDPATGSAAVALAVFLVDRGLLAGEGTSEFTVDQGAEIGRPSRLAVTVEATAGAATRTSVGGRVAAVARGELVAVPPAG